MYTGDAHAELDVQKAQDDLVHSFRSGASACLICIENIKKNDPVSYV